MPYTRTVISFPTNLNLWGYRLNLVDFPLEPGSTVGSFKLIPLPPPIGTIRAYAIVDRVFRITSTEARFVVREHFVPNLQIQRATYTIFYRRKAYGSAADEWLDPALDDCARYVSATIQNPASGVGIPAAGAVAGGRVSLLATTGHAAARRF